MLSILDPWSKSSPAKCGEANHLLFDLLCIRASKVPLQRSQRQILCFWMALDTSPHPAAAISNRVSNNHPHYYSSHYVYVYVVENYQTCEYNLYTNIYIYWQVCVYIYTYSNLYIYMCVCTYDNPIISPFGQRPCVTCLRPGDLSSSVARHRSQCWNEDHQGGPSAAFCASHKVCWRFRGHLSIYLSIYLSVYLSIYLIYLSIYLTNYHLSIHPPIRPSIYWFNLYSELEAKLSWFWRGKWAVDQLT